MKECVKCKTATDWLNDGGYCRTCQHNFILSQREKKKLNLDVCFDYPKRPLVVLEEKKKEIKPTSYYWSIDEVRNLFANRGSFGCWYGHYEKQIKNSLDIIKLRTEQARLKKFSCFKKVEV